MTTIDWNAIDEQDVAHLLANVQINHTVEDYHGDHSVYEYAVLCHLAKRIDPRTWYEFDEPTMSRLLADAARERLPLNPKWSQRYRSLFPDRGGIDRILRDAERVAMTVGRAQGRMIMERWHAEEAAEQAGRTDEERAAEHAEIAAAVAKLFDVHENEQAVIVEHVATNVAGLRPARAGSVVAESAAATCLQPKPGSTDQLGCRPPDAILLSPTLEGPHHLAAACSASGTSPVTTKPSLPRGLPLSGASGPKPTEGLAMTAPRIVYAHDEQGIARDADGRAVYLVALNGGEPVLLDEDEILRLVDTGLVRANNPEQWLDTFRRFGGEAE